MLTSPKAFGLTTATPLQRAICRAMDGRPLGKYWDDPVVRAAFAGVLPPELVPSKFLILAAIRGAKSMIAAAKAICDSQNCDLTGCSVGDEVLIPVLSTDKYAARAVFSHIVGQIQAKPLLKALMIGEPTGESLWVRHPTGKPVEIRVTALSKHGSTLVGRWLAACIFDEAPRMAGQEDGVENLDDALAAITGRMKGQIMMIGSPYAPFGPVYNMVQEFFGKPTEHLVIVRAPGPAMNPHHWTPERVEKIRVSDPKSYWTDCLGNFADPEEALFSSIELDAATRKDPLVIPPEKNTYYAAAMDPATRGNAWTLAIVKGLGLGGPGGIMPTYEVVLAKQWVGSKAAPLRPDAVLAEVATVCQSYGVDSVVSDQHAIDAVQDLAMNHGLTVIEHAWTAENRLKLVENVRLLISEGCLRVPADPVLRSDLLTAKKRVTQNGVTLVLPKSSEGRHCDFVPALASALAYPPDMPTSEVVVEDPLMESVLERMREAKERDPMETAALRLVS